MRRASHRSQLNHSTAAKWTYVCAESVLYVILALVSIAYSQGALPGGIYHLIPNLYQKGYLTYTNEGVTGRGTTPTEGILLPLFTWQEKGYRVCFS